MFWFVHVDTGGVCRRSIGRYNYNRTNRSAGTVERASAAIALTEPGTAAAGSERRVNLSARLNLCTTRPLPLPVRPQKGTKDHSHKEAQKAQKRLAQSFVLLCFFVAETSVLLCGFTRLRLGPACGGRRAWCARAGWRISHARETRARRRRSSDYPDCFPASLHRARQ